MAVWSFSGLKKRRYPEGTFYVCPRCGAEMLEDFFEETNQGLVCIDCASEIEPEGFDEDDWSDL